VSWYDERVNFRAVSVVPLSEVADRITVISIRKPKI